MKEEDIRFERDIALHKAEELKSLKEASANHDRHLSDFVYDVVNRLKASLKDTDDFVNEMIRNDFPDTSIHLMKIPFGNVSVDISYSKPKKILVFGEALKAERMMTYQRSDNMKYFFDTDDKPGHITGFSDFIVRSGVTKDTLDNAIKDFGLSALEKAVKKYNSYLDDKLKESDDHEKVYNDIFESFGDISQMSDYEGDKEHDEL